MALTVSAFVMFAGLVKHLVEQGFAFGIDGYEITAETAFGIDNDALIIRFAR